MRNMWNRKVMLVAGLLGWVFLVRILTGCSVEKENQDKVRDLEFTVVGESDLPEELKNLREEDVLKRASIES